MVPPVGVPAQFVASNSSAPISGVAVLMSPSISVVNPEIVIASPFNGDVACK